MSIASATVASATLVIMLFCGIAVAESGCPGDLNRDGAVTVDELVRSVDSALQGCPRFVDNQDGTVTDAVTRLTWELKVGVVGTSVNCSTTTCGNPHSVNNLYRWSASGTAPDGGLFTDFLDRVNGRLCASSTCPGLGGYSDWRVPTLSELQTLVDDTQGNCGDGTGPCINPIFGRTVPGGYWSASTHAGNPGFAWGVLFGNGGSDDGDKASNSHVRAVRGGL